MALLWVKASAYAEDPRIADTSHDDHALHPAFAHAGIKPSPCCYSRCEEQDDDHSAAFDEAERRHFAGEGEHVLVDLSQPVHGFESHADKVALQAYTIFPTAPHVQRPPTWFKFKGEHHIMDGHHRTAAALRRNDGHLPVKMIDLDKDGWRP